MATEKQKYISGVWRNVGFALLTPTASVAFQWLVLQKGTPLQYSMLTVLPFIAGWSLIAYGYILLGEKDK